MYNCLVLLYRGSTFPDRSREVEKELLLTLYNSAFSIVLIAYISGEIRSYDAQVCRGMHTVATLKLIVISGIAFLAVTENVHSEWSLACVVQYAKMH